MFVLRPRLRRMTALVNAFLNDPRQRGVRLVFAEPNYYVVDRFHKDSVILDMGLGYNADFSAALIKKYELTSYGFDPTERHHRSLEDFSEKSCGRFILKKVAIGPERGILTFHESQVNISGSLLTMHKNVTADLVRSYNVKVVTLTDAIKEVPEGKIDLIKMDIEGTEYSVLGTAPDELLKQVGQWVIEFHHDVINGIDFRRTKDVLRRFRRLGYGIYTLDNVNFLFYLA